MSHLSRFEKVLFWVFVAWLCAGLVLNPLGLTPDTPNEWTELPPWLRWFIGLCLHFGGQLVMVLAAINTHVMLCRQWQPVPARWFAFWCMLIGGAVEAIGTLTGVPFGQYYYTDNFGLKLFGILPYTIPLAWYIVVTNFLLILRACWPDASTSVEAAIVATAATFFDWVMEPFATTINEYWLWEGDVIPIQNYIAWWVVTFVIVRLCAPPLVPRWPQDIRPPIIVGGMLLLFIVVRIAHGV